MLKKVLPENLFAILEEKVNFSKINEIRLRVNSPIMIASLGQVYYLGTNGLTLTKSNAIFANKQMLEDIIYKASEFSIYSVNEEIKQGFLVLASGERIGVSGTFVIENGNVKTITNFTSLNIRIPHSIRGCCLPIFNQLVSDRTIFNTLIISPPALGKTTFLRDFAFQLCEKNFFLNLLILDERGEIAGKNNNLGVGDFCDILSFCTKKTGFIHGIRSLNPSVIFTDELGDSEDFKAVKYASNCGVKIVATIHANSLEQLKSKDDFAIISSVFERYVLLGKNGQAGQIIGVYNKNFAKI